MANVRGTDVQKKVENKNVTKLKDWFNEDNFKKKILSALPKVINRDAFITNAYNIYANDTKLQECSISSFLDSLMQAAKVGLMPNTPLKHCDIIPYKEKGVMKAHFQMEYRGHVELALRTGLYQSIYAHEVYPQDEFKACYGLNKDLIHIPSENPIPEGTKPTHYYAVYKLQNGGYDFVYWTRDRVLKHRDRYSKSYINAKKYGGLDDNTWVKDEIAMGKKTMLIQVLNTAPKSTEMVRALSYEPEGEYLKEYFNEEKDITPPVEELTDDTDDKVSLADLENIAKEAGYSSWKEIIIEGCKIKDNNKKPVFDASVNEKEAKEILQNNKDKFGLLYEHFNRLIDQDTVKAGKG